MNDSSPHTSPVYYDPNNVAHDLRDFDNIPIDLRVSPQWVVWKLELRKEKLTKVPYTAAGSMADSTDPQTWATFESCRDALRSNKYFGLGFVFADGGEITGIDLDKHRDPASGKFDAFAAEYIARLNTYTEESQSGTGAHAIAHATIPDDKGRRDAKSGVEMYSKARFFVMTGKHVDGTPRTIEPRQQAVAGMFREIFAPKEKLPVNKPAPAHALTLTDQDLISKASQAKNGAAFSALWRGDFAAAGYGSQSEADAAMLGALYFWTGGDKDRSFSLFSQSRLNRDKWQRKDYRESTWQLVAHGEVYSSEARTPQAAPRSNRAEVANETQDAINHFKSDVGYGDAFVQHHARSIRYCADEKIWLVFDDVSGWRRDETGTAIKSLAADYARELYQAALTEAATKEPEIGKRLISNAAGLGNKKRIDPALSFAACNPAVVVRAEQLDADPFLVGVQNGVVNLADGTFQAHRREHLVTRRLAVNYDANATAPTWEKFLAEVQPEKEIRDFLQRLCSYALTGEIREHVLPFHYGIGANGKGTFLEHGLLKLAGDYGAKLTDSLVYASDNGRLPHLELANLCGKRFALGEENSESGRLNEALLKSMTGGDRQKGRFHYGNFVEYAPTYKIALVGNHKPRIDGTDDGIWRRFILVDWKIQIPEGQRDTTLKDKLAAEMPGILNWCIAGARAWITNGLNPPASCRAATAAFRDNSDKLVEFIAENFTADPDSYCTKADVFVAYRKWAEREGIKYPMSKRALGFQLINRGWQEFKQGHENSNCWRGYHLQN